MLPYDKAAQKVKEEFVADLDEDDIDSLPPVNEQQIRQLIRKLDSGESLDWFQQMKIGAYKKDICLAIVHHQYSSQEDLFQVIDKLSGCSHDFTSLLCKYVEESNKALTEFFLHGKEEQPAAVQKRFAQILLVANMKGQGYDAKSKLIMSTAMSLVQEFSSICKALETLLMGEMGLGILKDNFKFNFVDYIKSYQASFALINEVLFGLESCEFFAIMDVSREKFKTVLMGQADLDGSKLTKRDMQVFVKAYSAELKQLFPQAYRVFSSLNSAVQAKPRQLKNAPEAVKKEMRDFAKTNSFIIQALDNFFIEFGYPKQLVAAPVLSDEEEIKVIELIVSDESEDDRKALLCKYEMYCFSTEDEPIEKSVELYCSNASQLELTFNYPKRLFKHNIEELTQLRINAYFEDRKDLLNHFQDLFNACANTDDVEYLAYALYRQNMDNIDQLTYEIARVICRPWMAQKPAFMAHLIAAFAYNGIELPFVDREMSFADFCASEFIPMSQAAFGFVKGQSKDQDLVFQFINYMLFYRLVSTRKILELLCERLAKLQKGKISETTFLPDGDIVKHTTFVYNLFEQVLNYAIVLDPKLFEVYKMYHDKCIPVLKQMARTEAERAVCATAAGRLTVIFEQAEKLYNSLEDKRKEIQRQIELAEAKRKDELRMARLKISNPKLYQREYEKRIAAAKKAEEEERSLAERTERNRKEKEERARRIAPFNLGIIGDLITEYTTTKKDQVAHFAKDIFETYTAYLTHEEARQKAIQLEGEEDQKIKIKLIDRPQQEKQFLKSLHMAIQERVNFESYPLIAQLYQNLMEDFSLKPKFVKFEYVKNVMANSKTDAMTLSVKLMLHSAGQITDQELRSVANAVIPTIQFAQQQFTNDMDVLSEKAVEISHLFPVEVEDILALQTHASFLMAAALKLDSQEIAAVGLLAYCGLGEQKVNVQPLKQECLAKFGEEVFAQLPRAQLTVVEQKAPEIVVDNDDFDPKLQALL